MRHLLIVGGLMTAFLWSDFGGPARAMAQVVASPGTPNAAMMRQMRLRMPQSTLI